MCLYLVWSILVVNAIHSRSWCSNNVSFVRFSFFVWKTVVSTQRKNGTTWVMTWQRKFFNSFVQACVSDPDFFLFERIWDFWVFAIESRFPKWMWPKIGVPQYGWFIMENPYENGWFGGKNPTIFGHTRKSRSSWGQRPSPTTIRLGEAKGGFFFPRDVDQCAALEQNSVVATHIFLCSSRSYLGKWSNLTTVIFFKWVGSSTNQRIMQIQPRQQGKWIRM